jgi:2-aminoadipate transaminase
MDRSILALHRQAAARPDVIGLAGGLPADELLPCRKLARALAEVATSRDALQYGWPEGVASLRTWIAERLRARGAPVDAERVIVTAGAQQALAIAAELIGGTISVGDATYAGALDAFRRAGAHAVVEGGAGCYVIAGVSNPQGVAREAPPSQGPTIVDEAYVELRFDGRVSAPRIADNVWHVGTLSKTLAPGLRIGWLVPPQAQLAAALELKHASDLQTSTVAQAAAAHVLALLDYDLLVDHARACYADRAARLAEALRRHLALPFVEPEGGFSIWIETDERGDELALLRAALAEGVVFDPGSLFRPVASDRLAMRLSFSTAPIDQLAEGARRLARAFHRRR